MAVYSGKDAYLDGVPCIQSWDASEAVTAQRYAASCVPGATAVPAGIVNWTGNVKGLGAFPSGVLPGVQIASPVLVINNTGGSLKSLGGVPILFEQLTIDLNKDTYAPIGWTASWGAQGALTEGASGADDSVVSEAPSGKDLAITIVATPLTVSLKTAQIILRRPHSTYVDGGATKRTAGNLECDINFAVQDSSVAVAAYAKNALSLTKIYTSATAFWEFSKIRYLGKSGFSVDRVSNNILGYTVNGQWSAVEGDVLGYIGYFDGSDYTMVYGEDPSA